MLAGAAFWLTALYLWHRERRLRTHGLRASGEVIRVAELRDSEEMPQFLRVVRFQPVEGRAIEFTDLLPSIERGAYAAGQTVTVLYDASDSGHARVDPGGTRGASLVFLFVVGLCFVLLACVGFAVGR